MKNARLLMITSLIMIVIAAANLILSVISIVELGLPLKEAGSAEVGVLLMVSVFSVALCSAVLMLIAGIMGLKSGIKRKRSRSCFVLGLITLTLYGIAFSMSIIQQNGITSVALNAAGVGLLILYLIAVQHLGSGKADTVVAFDQKSEADLKP